MRFIQNTKDMMVENIIKKSMFMHLVVVELVLETSRPGNILQVL